MIQLDTSYLNRTENQTRRAAPYLPPGVLWHETMSKSSSPFGTLDWNLKRKQYVWNPRTGRWDEYLVESSYNYLIARDGRIFHYLDERTRIAWHAGVNTRIEVAGRLYQGGELNIHFIGVEVDGPCDGTPITDAQRDAIIRLMHYFQEQYNIPLNRPFHITHAEAVKAISPSYRSDPRGFSVDVALQLARQALVISTPPTPAPRWRVVSGPVNVRSGPGTSYPRVGEQLAVGSTVDQAGELPGEVVQGEPIWVLVKDRGWVSKKFLAA